MSSDVLARATMKKVSWRLIPLLILAYLIAYMDRVNISFAATQMNADLGFSATIYGLGGGLFFLGYALFEVPSNIFLVRFGARQWIARIMITWGLLAAGMMFVQTPVQFYVMRFLLGVAEAGFFPGVIYYMSQWFPLTHRGRAFSRFYAAAPLSSLVMGAISGPLLGLDGHGSLQGWQWLFLVQGLPAVVVGLLVLVLLPDRPAAARWLQPAEKDWIAQALQRDAERIGEPARHSVLAVLRHPLILQLALFGFLIVSANLAFQLSAPQILGAAAGLGTSEVGYLVSVGGAVGSIVMLITGWITDRRGERFSAAVAGNILLAGVFVVLLTFREPAVIIAAYLVFAACNFTTLMVGVAIWPDVLHMRLLAVGSAAINAMANLGGFLAPFIWGAARDATGGYRAGMMVLPMVYILAAAVMLLLRYQVRRGPVAHSPR